MNYSKELVERYRKYMEEKYGELISPEKAQLHLKSLTSLFFGFTNSDVKKE